MTCPLEKICLKLIIQYVEEAKKNKNTNAVVTGNTSGWNGFTPLHISAYKGYKKIINILLAYDKSLANVVVTDNKFWLAEDLLPFISLHVKRS